MSRSKAVFQGSFYLEQSSRTVLHLVTVIGMPLPLIEQDWKAIQEILQKDPNVEEAEPAFSPSLSCLL